MLLHVLYNFFKNIVEFEICTKHKKKKHNKEKEIFNILTERATDHCCRLSCTLMQKHLKKKKKEKEKVWTECRNHNNILLLYCTCPLITQPTCLKSATDGGVGEWGREVAERRGSWVLFCADEAVSFCLHVVCVLKKKQPGEKVRRRWSSGCSGSPSV